MGPWCQWQIYGEILFLMVALSSTFVSSQADWLTVMGVTNSNGSQDAFSLLTSQGSLNEAANKELAPASVVVSAGDFKSAMLDSWTAYRPAKVRLALLNSQGSLMWYAEFNHTASSDKDPHQWLQPGSLSSASDPKLSATDLSIVFNETALLMSVNNGTSRRLQMTWVDTPLFLVCTNYASASPSPLTAPNSTSNKDMLANKLNEPYYTFRNLSGSSIWTGSGQIVKFRLYSSIEADCGTRYQDSSIYQPYLDYTLSPKVFVLKYDQGESNTTAEVVLDTTVAATCLWISVAGRVDPATSDISVYATSHGVLEATTFVLQWWIDLNSSTVPAVIAPTTVSSPNSMTTTGCTTITVCDVTSSYDVTLQTTPVETADSTVSDTYRNVTFSPYVVVADEALAESIKSMQARLRLSKGETAKFKRQFVSVSDTRPSAVFLGVVGVACICFVLLGVLALDFTHIARDAKVMMANIRDCGSCLEKTPRDNNFHFNSDKPGTASGSLA